MSPLVIGLILAAALLHATWNAILRGGADRLWSITVMCGTQVVVVVPFLILLGAPAPGSWPFIALSSALQVGYCLFLVRAYREGGLAQVYPIARGTSPLLVTLGALALAGERPTAVGLAGIALVCLGIMALAFEKARPSARSTLSAMACGVFIAAYTLTDGVGARLSGNSTAYTAWLYLVQGAAMPLVFLAVRGRLVLSLRRAETWKAVAGGVFGMLSYGVVIWALTLAPMGRVSALRETSILFAAVIGVVFLKEKLTAPRIVAALMIAGGAVLLSTAH
jgi:drug/metabolite transporter (DMT)-like permease